MKLICRSDSNGAESETFVKLANSKMDRICVSRAYAALDNGFKPLQYERPAGNPLSEEGVIEDACCEDEQRNAEMERYHVSEPDEAFTEQNRIITSYNQNA